MTRQIPSLPKTPWPSGLLVLAVVALGVLFLTRGPDRSVSVSEAGPHLTDSPASHATQQAFQGVLDVAREQYAFPGATAAYVFTGGTSGGVATGWADVERKQPMTPASRMLAASIGKSFVAATAVALAEEGTLDLDAPIDRWLQDRPWFQNVHNRDAITLRHLLSHRSGLPDHVHVDAFAEAVSRRWQEPNNPFPPDTLVQYVLGRPALFEPGDGWAYSDTGYILVGMILEAVTGRDYYDLVQERFLTPLDLRHTSPSNTRALSDLAAGYTPENPFGWPTKSTRSDGTLAWHPGIEWTGGGLVSTSGDLARWGAALFGGRAVPPRALDQMLRADPIDPETPDALYGLGVAVYRSSRYGTVYGHGGWIPGYVSSLRYYADHGVAIAFQINTDQVREADVGDVVQELEKQLADVVLQQKLGE